MSYTYRGIAGLSDDTDAAAIDTVQEVLIDGLRAGRTAVAKVGGFTFALTDVGELITLSGTFTATVPTNASVAFTSSPCTIIPLQNIGSGVVTIAPVNGTVTILGSVLALNAYESGTLIKIGTNTWVFSKGGAGASSGGTGYSELFLLMGA